MSELLLSERPGIKTYFDTDESGRVLIRTYQDAEPIVEQNKRLQTMDDGKVGDWAKRAATIPQNVYYQWVKELGIDPKAMTREERSHWLRRKLRDPDYRHFRTSPGRI